MSKGNPIVGLAHVVVSQQEMLEKANEQIEELKQELVNINHVKSQKLEDLWKDFSEVSERKAQLEEERNDLAQHNDALTNEIQEMSETNNRLRELIKQDEQRMVELDQQLASTRLSMEHIGWHSYDPEQRYALDEYGQTPMVHGLYYHHDNSTVELYDAKNNKHVPLKFKFDVYGVQANVEEEGFTISPYKRGENGSTTLIAVRISYFSHFIGKKWDEIKPRIYDSSIEERYLEALADPNHADAEGE